jgi:hypothetical protein
MGNIASVSISDRASQGNKGVVEGSFTLSSSYATSGDSYTSALLGMSRVDDLKVFPAGGYTFEASKTNNTSGLIKAYINGDSNASQTATLNLNDDDSAASNGLALYFRYTSGLFGQLAYVSPTNINSYFQVGNGSGINVAVNNDDNIAVTTGGGVIIYFDEDATAGSRLLFISPMNKDGYVATSDPDVVIKITDADGAASAGVQVYFDEDASNDYEKALFVSPTNADGTETVGGTYTFPAVDTQEVASGQSLTGITARFKATGAL